MSTDDRARWNERYASGEYRPRVEPTPLVERAVGYVGSGRALVLACGTGRNALHLAAAGFEVDAVDISEVAIDMARQTASDGGLDVRWHVEDLGTFDVGEDRYDLITSVRYTNRELWPKLTPALVSDGWLLMDQHLKTDRDVLGPTNEYRVEPGELLAAFPDLRVIEYFEQYRQSDHSDRMSATVGYLGCKGSPGW